MTMMRKKKDMKIGPMTTVLLPLLAVTSRFLHDSPSPPTLRAPVPLYLPKSREKTLTPSWMTSLKTMRLLVDV